MGLGGAYLLLEPEVLDDVRGAIGGGGAATLGGGADPEVLGETAAERGA